MQAQSAVTPEMKANYVKDKLFSGNPYMNKTKVMISGERQKVTQKAVK